MAIRTGILGYSFTAVRTIQLISLITIIALTARLSSYINKSNAPSQPAPLTWAITISALLGSWVLVTLVLHVMGSVIRYIITTVLDLIFIPLLIVCAVLIGKPVSDINCSLVGKLNNHIKKLTEIFRKDSDSSQLYPSSELNFPPYDTAATSPGPSVKGLRGLNTDYNTTVEDANNALGDYRQWAGRVENTCTQMKVTFGFLILVILLTTASAVLAYLVWRKSRRIPELRPGVDYDGGYTGRIDGEPWGMGVQVPIQVPTRTEEEAKRAARFDEEEEERRRAEAERPGRRVSKVGAGSGAGAAPVTSVEKEA
ncbi:hypothetical protein DFH27DRAFT_304239 [Peziza echinospora]|nr:hypothetical protein DFH27DRAFT_304239 [Peziza echinospora]